MESKTPVGAMKDDTLVKLEKEMADLSTVSPVTVASADQNVPSLAKTTAAASDDVTTNASGKESGAVSNEKKKKKKNKSKKVPESVKEEWKEETRPIDFQHLTSTVYSDFFKLLAAGEHDHHNQYTVDYMVNTYSNLTELDKKTAFNWLVKMIEDCTPLFCSFCPPAPPAPFQLMFTARQTIMHIGSREHIAKIRSSAVLSRLNAALMNVIGEQRVDKMFKQEAEQVRSQQKKWSSINPASMELRPSVNEIELMASRFEGIVYGVKGGMPPSTILNLHCTDVLVKTLRQRDSTLMHLLKNHIENAKTRCFPCKLIFADAAEYYDHLITYYHLSRVDAYDAVTFMVNAQKPRIGREREIPPN